MVRRLLAGPAATVLQTSFNNETMTRLREAFVERYSFFLFRRVAGREALVA
ncbi:MAG TPA: hypothetical protein VFR64_13560 [Methylomirabilota bacterium]|nr:hypothetical protein [Methylomirabilota bacterium]